VITGDIQKDALKLLSLYELREVAEHTLKVANEAKKIAGCFGVSEEKAFVAGLLHDIGNIIPLQNRVSFCNDLGIQMFEEEKLVPSMLHPKLSRIISNEVFQVDTDICNAIECHSTLRAYAGKLDLVLFVADKVSWPRIYNEQFIDGMLEGLKISLECSAIEYLKYLCSGHATVLHPWAIEAYSYLKGICK
jgi:putative nucleotidyltransferase with HDIG domain